MSVYGDEHPYAGDEQKGDRLDFTFLQLFIYRFIYGYEIYLIKSGISKILYILENKSAIAEI